MSKQNTPTGLFSPSGFSFGKLLTPRTKQVIDFDAQPSQSGTPTVKKSGLEAYAKKNKLTLPADFSDKVLECEMELERDEISIEAVTKLTDLYTQAMAFYEAEGNHKHKYFAKKLQDLMLKPIVKETMVREIAPVDSVEDDKELRRMRLESQVSQVNTEKEAFALVKTHENKEKEIKKVLEKDLTSQRDRIKKKLAERKVKSQTRAQSVTYISDENSSTTEEAQTDFERDLDVSPKAHKLIKIEEAEEADENRYGTPPRRRSKDGQMIFYFPKGKKNLKKLFLEELKEKSEAVKKVRGHARRYSENKPPVLEPVSTIVAAKRVGRAQSFCTRNAFPTIVEKARKISSNSIEKDGEETKTDNHEKEVRSLPGIGKDEMLENHSIVEKKEEGKPKSNNTVEETDEEGSKNDSSSSKNSVALAHEEEESPKENNKDGAEKAEEGIIQATNNEEKLEKEGEVVVLGSVVINNEASHDEVPEVAEDNKEEVVQVERENEVVAAVVEQQEEKQVEQIEKEEEAVAEIIEQKEEKQAENEPAAEVAEVVQTQQETVKEEILVEKVEVTEEANEHAIQENKENEIVAEQQELENQHVQEKNEVPATVELQEEVVKEEIVEEIKQVEAVNEIQVVENVQGVAAVKEVADNTQEETNKEEEETRQTESVNVKVEAVIAESVAQVQTQEENKVEVTTDAPEIQEEKQAQVEAQEEVKIETENIPQSQEPVVEIKAEHIEEVQVEKEEKEEKEEAATGARRRRTDSEIADEEKLKMMRKIDEENKYLLGEFIIKQEKAREEAGKQVEEKFTNKLQAMEEDMEPDEKLSMMWQKAVAKINKDKETELQKVLEGLVQEHSQEAEKYKKKLQQQKMFKLAQMSS